jgi:hypothetical protein
VQAGRQTVDGRAKGEERGTERGQRGQSRSGQEHAYTLHTYIYILCLVVCLGQ